MQDSFYFLNYNFLEEIHKLANEENSVIEESTLEIILKNCVKNGSIKIEEEPGSSVVFDTEEAPLPTPPNPDEIPPEFIRNLTEMLEKTKKRLTEIEKNKEEYPKTELHLESFEVQGAKISIGDVVTIIDNDKSKILSKGFKPSIDSIEELIKSITSNNTNNTKIVPPTPPGTQEVAATAGGNPKTVKTKKKRDNQSKRISHRNKNKTGTSKNRKTKKNGTRKNKKSKK